MRLLLSIILIFLPIYASASPLIVTYPKGLSAKDTRRAEVVELINMALQKTEVTHGPFILKPSEYVANPLRQVSEIKTNQSDRINLAWLDTDEKIIEELFPIYIPIQMGIVGYRVFLIKADSVNKFTKDMTFNDLQKMENGIGLGWMDVDIFKLNKLNFITGIQYESLFRMLSIDRFDYFSRGINEAFVELKNRKHLYPNLIIEKNIALYYRHPIYLYTSKKNVKLHDRLEIGLNIMISDGSFTTIFCKYNKFSIEQANLQNRKIFNLKYHLEIPRDIIDRSELWFDPLVDTCQ